jgi:hypothetical protein
MLIRKNMSATARIRTLAVAVGLVALWASASPAWAAHTLHLSAPSAAVVGKPMILQATGTIDSDELEFLYWFSLDAIPTSVTTTCPPDRWEGVQFAQDAGGSVVVLSQQEVPDAAGNFSIPIAVTPSAPGSLLLCGYSDDGQGTTLARASMILDIQPKPSTPPRTRWTRATIRADVIAGIRGCRALLSHPSNCERKIVRLANSRCRRLQPRRSRTTCLRAVRRVARSQGGRR